MQICRISTKDIGWSSEKMFIEIGVFFTQGSYNSDSPTSFEARISITIFSALIPVTVFNSNHPQIYFFTFRKHTKKVLPCLESKIIFFFFYKCINSSKQLPIHTLFLENKRVDFGIGIFLKT